MGIRILLAVGILFYAFPLVHAQKSPAKPVISKNEVKLSGGIFNLPNFNGSVTFSYMFCAARWLGVGLNANWQSPSDTETYRWREYYADGSFKDFVNSSQNEFYAIAPEIRILFLNKKWATLYTGISVGTGIQTGLNKDEYWYWNITAIGGNWYIGRNRRLFVGGELGAGFKGIYSIHTGFRF